MKRLQILCLSWIIITPFYEKYRFNIDLVVSGCHHLPDRICHALLLGKTFLADHFGIFGWCNQRCLCNIIDSQSDQQAIRKRKKMSPPDNGHRLKGST